MRRVTPASRRRFTAVALPLCLAAGVTAAAALPPVPAPAGPPPPSVRDGVLPPVVLCFSASVTLADGVRTALRREVEAIWRHEGLDVHWATSSPSAVPALRVVVVDVDGHRVRADDHAWPVAELLLDDLNRPVAVSSLAAAERVLRAAEVGAEPDRLRQRRLGLVLGRALAHEIGHYLLNTPGHARRGLMRARIGPGDLVDLRDGGFFLDAPAARWLRTTLLHAPPAPRLAGFDYAP